VVPCEGLIKESNNTRVAMLARLSTCIALVVSCREKITFGLAVRSVLLCLLGLAGWLVWGLLTSVAGVGCPSLPLVGCGLSDQLVGSLPGERIRAISGWGRVAISGSG
jgi:hypothetical protein